MRRNVPLVAALCFSTCLADEKIVVDASSPVASAPGISSIGPRLISNQTSYPLSIRGTGLKPGLTLSVQGRSLPMVVLDDTHAWARMPAGLEVPAGVAQAVVEIGLEGQGAKQKIKVINDTAFPVLTAMALASDGKHAFVASTTEDTVYVVDTQNGEVARRPVGDGPTALAAWKTTMLVAHRYAPELRVLDGENERTIVAPTNVQTLLVDGDVVFIAEHARDTVSAIDLTTGKEVWRAPVAPNPGPMAMTSRGLAVGSLQTGEVEWLDAKTGALVTTLALGPGAEIAGPKTVGGVDASMSKYVMNGSMVRGLAWSSKTGTLLMASHGPNLGPNPQRVEVSQNGGVATLAVPKTGDVVFRRHLGFGGGVTQALAIDEKKQLLYAADLGVGLVRVLDLGKLTAKTAAESEKSIVQELAIPPPADFPLIRPAEDFGVKNRAGVSLHSGPSVIALTKDGKSLWVLNRFTGTLAQLDVANAGKKGAKVVKQLPVTNMLTEKDRRLGEVLYFTDVSRSAMSCDTCHPDGHSGGLLFEKTKPMRIYRSTTVRGALETPPYFTPASQQSLGDTAHFVMSRNRFENPTPNEAELDQVVGYTASIPTLPNPFIGEDGAPPETLTLPDGKTSHPRKGVALFDGKAGCAECHPSPQFTTDQDGPTRGKFLDVGTPHLLPLREEMQSPFFHGFAPPALVGAWDIFPMLTTGSGGYAVEPDGRIAVDDRFPLRKVVTAYAPKHGHADALTPEELDDLLGYVHSL